MSETRKQRGDDEEDWSQITNQVMRKRIQNRLAQRKHRKGINARLKELERLVSCKDSPAETTEPSSDAPARGSSSPAKDHPAGSAGSRADMPDLASIDVPMSGGGFSLDGSAATYTYCHPPSNYPGAVNENLNNVPFTNTPPVPEWAGDGSLSQGYAHLQGMAGETHRGGGWAGEIDSLGRDLDQHSHAIEYRDMQSPANPSTYVSSWASSDRPGQSTDLSTIPERILPSDSVSSRENEISVGPQSTRTSPSKRSSRTSSGSPRVLDVYSSSTDLELNRSNSSRLASAKASSGPISGRRRRNAPSATQAIEDLNINRDRPAGVSVSATLSSRISSAMETIRALGFSGIEELTAQFYTADLQDRPALADAQRISRRRGLPRILSKLREHAKDDWTEWEEQGYREEIVRAAEDILGDECRRFSEDDARDSKRGRNIAELKRQFQDELPSLYGLLGTLSLASQPWGDADHSVAIVHAINSLLGGSECTRECARSPR